VSARVCVIRYTRGETNKMKEVADKEPVEEHVNLGCGACCPVDV
jgi:hypothetical protein